jgi:hypothetical protein
MAALPEGGGRRVWQGRLRWRAFWPRRRSGDYDGVETLVRQQVTHAEGAITARCMGMGFEVVTLTAKLFGIAFASRVARAVDDVRAVPRRLFVVGHGDGAVAGLSRGLGRPCVAGAT